MITTRPDNWRDIRDEEGWSFTPAEKFEKLISKEGYFFVTEECGLSHETRYIRIKDSHRELPYDKMLDKRTHNIIVDYKDESITYEGADSFWHEVYGPEGFYEKLVAILKIKTVRI